MKHELKVLRAMRNLSQKDMANKLGVSLQTYNHWENNLPDVKISKVNAIAQALDVSIDDIILTNNVN